MSRHLLPIPPGGGWRDVVRGGRPATPSSLPGGGGTFTGAPRHLRKGPRGWRGVVVSAVCLLAGQFGHDTARGSRMILGVHPAPRPRGSLIPTGPAPFPRHGGGVLVRRWRFGRAHTGYLSCGAVARPPQEWANGDRRVGRRAWPRSTRQLLLHQRTAGWGGPPCRRTRTHNAGRRAAPIPAGQRMRWGWVVWVAAGTSPSDLGCRAPLSAIVAVMRSCVSLVASASSINWGWRRCLRLRAARVSAGWIGFGRASPRGAPSVVGARRDGARLRDAQHRARSVGSTAPEPLAIFKAVTTGHDAECRITSA